MTKWWSLAVFASLGLSMGCNMVTGADGITLRDGDFGEAPGPGSDGPDGPSPNNQGLTRNEPLDEVDVLQLVPADGVTLTRVALYQGVERELMANGSETSSAPVPVVAGRDALIRVFFEADGTKNVTGRLTLDDQVFLVPLTITGKSEQAVLESTINFQVPGDLLKVGSTYRVDVLQSEKAASGDNVDATFPGSDGEMASLAVEMGATLKITLVPIQYDGDGSGRMPDTSADQLKKYEEQLFARYPTSNLEFKVRNPVKYNGVVTASSGWSNLLSAFADFREQDGAANDTYYYGLIEPSATYNQYCANGCTTGLGYVASVGSGYSRASVGLGYDRDASIETALHEIGHTHGRKHTPCGNPSNPDEEYPHVDAKLGSWGYDLIQETLFAPNDFRDLMSYCDPTWVGDFTYNAFYERMTALATADFYVPPAQQNLTYERAIVDDAGQLTWLEPITLERPPAGQETSATITTTAGLEDTTATFIPYDHLDGGIIFIPPTSAPVLQTSKKLSVVVNGNVLSTQ